MNSHRNTKGKRIVALAVGVGAWSLFGATALAVPDNPNGGDNGANASGVYDATGVQGPGPGLGEGNAVGRPDDGAVGNADNKNPPGQLPGPEDANVGYECEAGPNYGVGQGNPAHTTCGSTEPTAVSTAPAVAPAASTGTTNTDPGEPGSQTAGIVPPVAPPAVSTPISSAPEPTPSVAVTPPADPAVTPPAASSAQGVSLTPAGPTLGPVGTAAPVGSLTPIGPTLGPTSLGSPTPLGSGTVSPVRGTAAPFEASSAFGSGLTGFETPGTSGLLGPGAATVPDVAATAPRVVGTDRGVTLAQLETAQVPAASQTRGTLATTGWELARLVLVSVFLIGLGAAFLSRTRTPAGTTR